MPQADSRSSMPTNTRRKALPAPLKRKKPLKFVDRHISDPAPYGLQCQGNCLSPLVQDGDVAICSPAVKVEEGMIVAIYLKAGGMPKLKRLKVLPPPLHPDSNVAFPIFVEMDNPLTTFMLNPDLVETMHVVVGVMRDSQYLPLPVAGREQRT